VYSNAPTLVTNSIIWNSVSGMNPPHFAGAGTLTITYSNVQGALVPPGVGNLNVDPNFVSSERPWEGLAPGSPCIDAGNDAVASSLDLYGLSRKDIPLVGTDGVFVDIGCNEYQ
jgi:hypothetical protein